MLGEMTVEEQPCGSMKDLNSIKGRNSMKDLNSMMEGLVWGDAFLFTLVDFGEYPQAGQ